MTVPENWTPLEVVTITKCLDEDGNVMLAHHASDGLRTWEAIGMCVHVTDLLRKALLDDGGDV